jgi:hypothetical protein
MVREGPILLQTFMIIMPSLYLIPSLPIPNGAATIRLKIPQMSPKEVQMTESE